MANSDATIEYRPVAEQSPVALAILYRGRWHVMDVDLTLQDAICRAQQIHARSGLSVQVRDDAGGTVFDTAVRHHHN